MATIIDLGKLRFEYQGEYDATKTYESNDVVKYGGNLYCYIYGLKTSGNTPSNASIYWDLMVSGFQFEGVYDSTATYNIGDGFAYGGKVYITTANSVPPSTEPPRDSYYSLFVDGMQYEATYDNTKYYQANDIVGYGGRTYIAAQDTQGNLPDVIGSVYWNVLSDGSRFIDSGYDSNRTFVVGDEINYGGNRYRAKASSFSNSLPTDAAKWQKIGENFLNKGHYVHTQGYLVNEVVEYGGKLYRALIDTNGNYPDTLAPNWELVVGGTSFENDWQTGIYYEKGDLVRYGGQIYIFDSSHTSTTVANDISQGKMSLYSGGFVYKGGWGGAGTAYVPNDIVYTNSSSYIALTTHTASSNFAGDLAAGNWTLFAGGSGTVLPTINPGDLGKSITVNSSGSGYELLNATGGFNTFFVDAEAGSDDSQGGRSKATPFKTIKFALERIDSAVSDDSGANLHIGQGTYPEILPMTVPAFTTITGEGLRNTIVKPAPGYDSAPAMFYLRDGTMMNGLQFHGLTSFRLDSNNPENIDSATFTGAFLRLDPTPLKGRIATKSPYIKDCSAFSTRGVGAYIDGNHLNNDSVTNGSMVFHAFTQIHDGGVGFWVKNGGLSEIVSCFTYYCDFGYAASKGGKIRALNGNNSYGTYGSAAMGYDSSETPVTGQVRGWRLNYTSTSLGGGEFSAGDSIRDSATGATAKVINSQTAANYLLIDSIVGAGFGEASIIRENDPPGGTGTAFAITDSTDAVVGPYGATMAFEALDSIPREGGSMTFNATSPADSGYDSFSYVIQSVSQVDSAYGRATVVFSTANKDDTRKAYNHQGVQIRYDYSQVRMTGHDFLNIGTGGVASTNHPNDPAYPNAQGNEVIERDQGRVYYISTDQDGNFRVGNYFRIDQATGRATLDASAFDLAGLTSLRLGSIGAQLGETINEFSADATLSGASNSAVPTEYAVKTYVDVNAIARIDSIESNGLGGGGSFATQAYNDSDTTRDTDGYITAATVGSVAKQDRVVYSSVVYAIDDLDSTTGGGGGSLSNYFPSAGGSSLPNTQYKRITSYTETLPDGTSNNVAITYLDSGSEFGDSGKLNTITLS